jgi:hypothetical protein
MDAHGEKHLGQEDAGMKDDDQEKEVQHILGNGLTIMSFLHTRCIEKRSYSPDDIQDLLKQARAMHEVLTRYAAARGVEERG